MLLFHYWRQQPQQNKGVLRLSKKKREKWILRLKYESDKDQ
jgi:hypothetical protein